MNVFKFSDFFKMIYSEVLILREELRGSPNRNQVEVTVLFQLKGGANANIYLGQGRDVLNFENL